MHFGTPSYTECLAFSICVINIPLFIPSFHGMEKCVQVEGPLCPMRGTPLSLGEAESRNGALGGKSWGDCWACNLEAYSDLSVFRTVGFGVEVRRVEAELSLVSRVLEERGRAPGSQAGGFCGRWWRKRNCELWGRSADCQGWQGLESGVQKAGA